MAGRTFSALAFTVDNAGEENSVFLDISVSLPQTDVVGHTLVPLGQRPYQKPAKRNVYLSPAIAVILTSQKSQCMLWCCQSFQWWPRIS